MNCHEMGTHEYTAHKTHTCIWCGEQISIGSRYTRQTVVCDGDFQSNRYHPECFVAMQEFASREPYYRDGFVPGSFIRGKDMLR
jgi:hypothetical protein